MLSLVHYSWLLSSPDCSGLGKPYVGCVVTDVLWFGFGKILKLHQKIDYFRDVMKSSGRDWPMKKGYHR